MKKVMFVLAAVGLMFGVSAATVKWNTGTLKGVDADGLWTSSAPSATSWSIVATLYASDGGAVGSVLETSNITSLNAMNQGTATFTGDYSFSTQYYIALEMSADFGNGDVQTFLNTSPVAFTTKGTGQTTANFSTLGVINTSSTTAQWSPVPEPTSGLLLLVGGALLALRRKRA